MGKNDSPSPNRPLRVLLVGNYLYDRQESMLRFADSLFEGLRAEGVAVRLIRPPAFFGRLKPAATGLGKWLGYLDKFLLFPFILRRQARCYDVVHLCDHSNAHYTRWLQAVPHLVTCNDMLAIRSALGEFPQNQTGWTGRILQGIILRGLKRARRLTCISGATRRDVLRLTGLPEARVDVTYMGLNYPYAPVVPDPEKTTAPCLLHVGGDFWYKNRTGVLAIYAELRRLCGSNPPRLVMVGPPLSTRIEGVETLSNVGNEALRALYSGAALLLFPSLEEGFGWPIVEAQACGCPVVTTRRAPMTEVGGDAAFFIDDPCDANAGARVVLAVLNQNAETRRLRIEEGLKNAAQFSTRKMIGQYRAQYEELRLR
jgi:glycosyltransferase involved in cell wall biosynthesis